MAKYKVIFDREACIGAFACTPVAEKFYKMADDSKVDLAGGKFNEKTKKWELIIESKEDLEMHQLAADACPVDVIVVEKISD